MIRIPLSSLIASLMFASGSAATPCTQNHDGLCSTAEEKDSSSLLQRKATFEFKDTADDLDLSPEATKTIMEVQLRQALKRFRFAPTHGLGGKLDSTTDGGVCDDDYYTPSLLEKGWSAHALEWTSTEKELCEHLHSRKIWIEDNTKGMHLDAAAAEGIFSKLCKKGQRPQILEPLAGILRDPRVVCDAIDEATLFSIDWLVFAGHKKGHSKAKNIFFDAGGTRFMDAMNFFTSKYEERGITFDKIYVWEATHQGTEAYWSGTPSAVREKWEPRLTFYDGVPCTGQPNHEHNPPSRILKECAPEDFCAFKLDIDTPNVELPIVQQLLDGSKFGEVLDEFFFEHHVHGQMQDHGWSTVNGTFADSYHIFGKLRQMGVRAHSWI